MNDYNSIKKYWIASSHNTVCIKHQIYIPGQDSLFEDQIIDSDCMFKSFIKEYSGGCVELDLGSTTDDDIYLWHSNALIPFVQYVTKGRDNVSLKDVFKKIKSMLSETKYPILFSIDMKGVPHAKELFMRIYNSFFNENDKVILLWNYPTKSIAYNNLSSFSKSNDELVRMYPVPLLSYNYNIVKAMLLGIQLISINYQYHDLYFHCFREVFRNGAFRKIPENLNNIKNVAIRISSKVSSMKNGSIWNTQNEQFYSFSGNSTMDIKNVNSNLFVIFIQVDNCYCAVELIYPKDKIYRVMECNPLNQFVEKDCNFNPIFSNILLKIKYKYH